MTFDYLCCGRPMDVITGQMLDRPETLGLWWLCSECGHYEPCELSENTGDPEDAR